MTDSNATVVIVVDNFEFLNITLDSLLRQDYKNLSVVAFYETSNLNVASILKHYSDKRLTLHGQVNVDGHGIKKVVKTIDSEYLVRVEVGSIFDKTWLSKCINAFNSIAMTVVCDSVSLDDAGNVIDEFVFLSAEDMAMAKQVENKIMIAPVVTRNHLDNQALDNILFPSTSLLLNKHAVMLNEVLCGVRATDNQVQSTSWLKFGIHTLTSSLSSFLTSANSYRSDSPQAESKYIAIYTSAMLMALKKFNLLTVSKMLLMALYKPGYRKEIIKHIRLGLSKNLKIAFDSSVEDAI